MSIYINYLPLMMNILFLFLTLYSFYKTLKAFDKINHFLNLEMSHSKFSVMYGILIREIIKKYPHICFEFNFRSVLHAIAENQREKNDDDSYFKVAELLMPIIELFVNDVKQDIEDRRINYQPRHPVTEDKPI